MSDLPNTAVSTPEGIAVVVGRRNQAQAYRAAAEAYPFQCCVVCGLQLPTCLNVAHLDHQAGNNDFDNLAWMCGTHHWMFDAGLHPIEAVKLLRAHWQSTRGLPDHKPRMKDAGARAAARRKRRATARKAVATRLRNNADRGAALLSQKPEPLDE